MKIQTLNGIWSYRIGKGEADEVSVPFSKLPVGHSECTRYFDADVSHSRIFIKFDGITYYAKVFVNNTQIGEMLPYSEYMFDITDTVKEKDNLLKVELEDLSPKFGPTAGWENFGGIIRDVSLVYHNENYITDVFFHSTLTDNYTGAEFIVETSAFSDKGIFEIKLLDGNEEIISYTQPAGEDYISQKISDIKLWSPDEPNLYRLTVCLKGGDEELDTYSCNVGFREFTCDKHKFLLNGKHIFLRGVCKHEMVGDSGHCPTEEQVERDMRMIKSTGSNFVRLVHYPHGKKVLDIADRLGLMVCEEPGLWWSDVSDPEVSGGSIEVLRRTIKRDRNHPSIMFWLCFNECMFTEKFLLDSAVACREADPTRMVSGANCMDNETTKKLYSKCGFDFYTMHPYAPTLEIPVAAAEYLTDKPLLFTEWGGLYVYDNPRLLGEFMDRFYSLYTDASDRAALAGALLWSWADVYDFNRGRPACIDGVLYEGLVSAERKPSLIYDAFCKGIERMDNPIIPDKFRFDRTGTPISGCNILAEGNSEDIRKLVNHVNHTDKGPRKRELTHGPHLTENPDGLLNTPLIISDGISYCADCSANAGKITLAGLTSLTKGYPLGGEYSEDTAYITLHFKDNTKETIPLKNGEHITTAFAIWKSSRINPIACKAQRYAFFDYGKDFDYYVMNTLDIKIEKSIEKIEIKSANNGYSLLIYGLFV